MENTTKRYWKGLEELRNDSEFVKYANREFPDSPIDGEGTYRRDFLKTLGFGIAAVTLASCETPVRKSIPYLNKPEDIEATIANWFASTYTDGGEYASVLVKTREGRPIKLEVNTQSSISKGLSARAHASVLSLYDNEKLKGPQIAGKDAAWETLDKEVLAGLTKSANVRIVSGSILSPSTKAVIAGFKAKYPSTQHISYDANSVSALAQAHGGIVPSFDFSKASAIVGLSCDFMGTWISPEDFSSQWAKGRKLSKDKKDMSQHFQFESTLSLAGSNADYRTPIKPSQEGLVVAALYNKIVGGGANDGGIKVEYLDKAAQKLLASRGSALVVSGSNDIAIQTLVAAINKALGSYGTTIDMGTPVNYRQGNDAAMNGFIDELKTGKVDAVIFYGVNPVYNHSRGEEIAAALPKVALSVAFNERSDETASLCKFIAPDSHYLESWNDAEPKQGYYSLCQPTISTIFKTRQAQDSLLKWSGSSVAYADFLENNWSANYLRGKSWTQVLHDGVLEYGSAASSAAPAGDVASAAASISKNYKASNNGLEFITYEKVGIGTGSQANNPWLQEFPDPITKACWDNYVTISPATAKANDLKSFDLVKLTVKGKELELPILLQPGQANDTLAVAIGYGRTKAGKSADGVGVNVFPFSGNFTTATITKTGDVRTVGQTQTHETVMARTAVLQESVLTNWQKNPKAGKHVVHIETSTGPKTPTEITLWNGHERKNHAWGMVIDLNACNGCGACVVSCQAENNIAVVGRKEVIMRREMHWMRIDRYYSTDVDSSEYNAIEKALDRGLEVAAANPEVTFQPLMCQHCNNAPCETVCPVLATTHSSEGLNQMTYNRCIGTRYCANNCPYKVRRFNWFKYFDEGDKFDFHFNNDLGKMVINPDVTVRSRGVMEKCSMCVQRIQAGKLEAKKERRRPGANEIKTACSQSCPTGAITFGDMNDQASDVAQLINHEKDGRLFYMLEEINVLPSVSYLTKIRNKDGKAETAHAEHKAESHEAGAHKEHEAK